MRPLSKLKIKCVSSAFSTRSSSNSPESNPLTRMESNSLGKIKLLCRSDRKFSSLASSHQIIFNHEIFNPLDSDLGNNRNTSFFYSVVIRLFKTDSLHNVYCNVRKKRRGQFDTNGAQSFEFRKKIRIQSFTQCFVRRPLPGIAL